MNAEYFKGEWDLSRDSNDNRADFWKELYRQAKYKEWESPCVIWHDELPGLKLVYLN